MRAKAIIVAGGTGSRMKTPVAKQFMELAGKPLLAHTLSRFVECHLVGEIVVVLPRDGFREHAELMAPWKAASESIKMVPGGEARQDSMANGLDSLSADYDGLVAVHDGARPLVDEELITRVIEMADVSGCAIAGLPVYETLKEVAEDGRIVGTADRHRLYRAQTPQCFRYEILRRALEQSRADGYLGTDEAALVERMGEPVRIVPGSETNIKVTTARDFEIAEYYLRRELKNGGADQ